MPANADVDSNWLKPIDTSSPRATLQGFIEFTNKAYSEGFKFLNIYMNSSALYLTAEELAALKEVQHFQTSAERALDVSELPSATVEETSRRLMIEMKEVLDRIDIPSMESIPDAQMMAKSEFKYWVIPNTEIRIQRVEKGTHTGEYLFTPDTLNRLPEFYAKVKNLPYKANASVGWYDFTTYSPAGLALALNNIVPPRWLLTVHHKQPVRTKFLDQPAWRWLSIIIILAIGFFFVRLCFRLSHYWNGKADFSEQWAGFTASYQFGYCDSYNRLNFWGSSANFRWSLSGVYAIALDSVLSLSYLDCLGSRGCDCCQCDCTRASVDKQH